MFKKAFLEECGNRRLRHEERLLRGELEGRGVPVTLFTAKRIQRRQLPLAVDTFVAGDFGVLENGQTALVEANDGYSLGAYQITASNYTNVLLTRWAELLSTATTTG